MYLFYHLLTGLQLKAEQKLDEFVDKQQNFDVETAIRVSVPLLEILGIENN